MADDAVLRSSLVCLAVVMLVVGLSTQSLEKIMWTYVVGALGIAGILLPDWGFFDRDISRWTTPVTAEERAQFAQRSRSKGFRMYYTRVAIYTAIYGIALYKWWIFVSTSEQD